MEMVSSEPDRVRMRLPFRDELTTLGDTVHGGAIAALADSAATAAAWSGVDPDNMPSRGTTISLDVRYVKGARGSDLLADATVTRRGRTICFLAVALYDGADDLVADARAVYKLG
jgi:uncharacterized protein (TIGR00369 family)